MKLWSTFTVEHFHSMRSKSSSTMVVCVGLNSDAAKANLSLAQEVHLEPVAAIYPARRALAEARRRHASSLAVCHGSRAYYGRSLAPTAVLSRFRLTPDFGGFSSIRCNISAIIKLYGEVLQLVEENVNAARAERLWAEQPQTHGTNLFWACLRPTAVGVWKAKASK